VAAPTVLVVDDDPLIVRLLQVNLELEGYRVLTASDGAACIEVANRERPDVIVLDVMMPNVDGLTATRHLKGDEATKGIPIMLLSAKPAPADVEAGRASGADEYMTKPFNNATLFERVAALLQSS
jgi:DNA-binding response OmpR family regulator